MNKTILITGANGFIGSYFVDLLYNNHNIVCVDFDPYKNEEIDYNHLENLFKNNKIETIYHFGAITDPSEKDESKLYKYNTYFTQRLADLFIKYEVSNFVFTSSAGVYGHLLSNTENENDGFHNLTPYAISKLQSEQLLLKGRKIADHQKIQVFRLFNVYGSESQERVKISRGIASPYAKFEHDLKRYGKIQLFDGIGSTRDFVSIGKVYKTIQDFVKLIPESGLWNLGSGESKSFHTVAKDVISKIYGQESNIEEFIEYIEVPKTIDFTKYQFYTKADNTKIACAYYKLLGN